MSTARRSSVTNEAAIRPHENAFRRFGSIPDIEVRPEPMTQPSPGMEGAPTDRQDTMEAHMPSSFRVYSPAETRNAPMRRSYHSIEIDSASESVGARTLLKWTGIGIVAGLCVLAGLMALLNVSGDVGSKSARATIGTLPEQPAAVTPAPVTPAPVTPAATPAEKPADIEIDAPPPPAKKAAAKKTAVTTIKKKG